MKKAASALALAGGTAAIAGANALAAKRTERLHPARGRQFFVDGIRLHVYERGSGSPVVFLHGNGVDGEDFVCSGVVERVATEHKVIVFDRPGFGYSSRPRRRHLGALAQAALIHHALRQLGVGPVTVVGHSWGTLVAVGLGLEYPDDVRGLVLISGYYFPSLRLDVPPAAIPAVPVLGDVARYTVSLIFGRLLSPLIIKQLFSPAPVAASFRSFPFARSLRPAALRAAALEAAWMVPTAQRLQDRYEHIRMPVSIVAGDGDKLVNHRAQSLRLADALPQARVEVIEGAGHMVHHTANDRVADVILQSAREAT